MLGPSGNWFCVACGTVNAPELGQCWKCHADRPRASGSTPASSYLLWSVVVIALVLAGTVGGFLLARGLQDDPVRPTPLAAQAPIITRTAAPTTPTPSPRPRPTAVPRPTPTPTHKPTPTPTPLSDLNVLRRHIPETIVDSCRRSRGAEKPNRAVASLTCTPRIGSVQIIGYHLFGSQRDMDAIYTRRLAQHSVSSASGDCRIGVPGDSSWSDVGGFDPRGRLGCFINEDGDPNLRWTIDDSMIYVGLVGYQDTMDELTRSYFEQWEQSLNYRAALAGFTAPGSTGEERAARMEVAEMEIANERRVLELRKEEAQQALQRTGIQRLLRWWASETGEYKQAH